MTYERLLELARHLADRPLSTVTYHVHAVGIDGDGPEPRAVPSGIGQGDGRNASSSLGALPTTGRGAR